MIVAALMSDFGMVFRKSFRLLFLFSAARTYGKYTDTHSHTHWFSTSTTMLAKLLVFRLLRGYRLVGPQIPKEQSFIIEIIFVITRLELFLINNRNKPTSGGFRLQKLSTFFVLLEHGLDFDVR